MKDFNIRNSLNLFTNKTLIEAIVFYIFWSIMLMIINSIIGGIMNVFGIINLDNFESSLITVMIVETILISFISINMLLNKNFCKPMLPIILLILSIILVPVWGYDYSWPGFHPIQISLIPVAISTTFKIK